jgi:hypothetical protein
VSRTCFTGDRSSGDGGTEEGHVAGTAMIKMTSPEEAERATALSKKEIMGRWITVSIVLLSTGQRAQPVDIVGTLGCCEVRVL